MRRKRGGRRKGTPNKLTAKIKNQIGEIVDLTLESINIQEYSKSEKTKLLQVLLQYIMPRLQSQFIEVEKESLLKNVNIQVLDGEGNLLNEHDKENVLEEI